MRFTGKFTGGLRIDMDSRKVELTIQSDRDDIGKEWDELRKCEKLTVEIKKYRKGRSLDANKMYWSLLHQLAEVLEVSIPFLHNTLLRLYGQDEIVDGHLMYLSLPDTDEGARIADEAQDFHIRPTTEVRPGKDGIGWRTYIMMRGSHTFDTAEMSRLINGLMKECKEQRIETMPQAEFDRMMEMYEKDWRRKHGETVQRADG